MAKILLAEDDQSMREFLTIALNKAGHNIVACHNGIEALETLKTNQDFNLLLTDIVMPGMDGIELSQMAVKLCPTIKVMFITGFAGVAMDNNLSQDDNAKVLSKPFHLKELVGQVESLLAAA